MRVARGSTAVRRLLVLGSVAPLLLVGAACGGSSGRASGADVTVMTRNLYLGADLIPAVRALALSTNRDAVAKATGQVWSAVQASNPPARMAAVAQEIADKRPDLVGLQEVTTWQVCSTAAACRSAYDFLTLLLEALAARGAHYSVVEGAVSTNFASPAIPVVASGQTRLVRLTDHDVVLYRTDAGLALSGAVHGHFVHTLAVPLVTGTSLTVPRGWASVEVSTRGRQFRFVNTHLEAFGIPGTDAEALRIQQVGELLAGPLSAAGETVLVGDLNSEAAPHQGRDAYDALITKGFRDAWTATHSGADGFSCCERPDLSNRSPALSQRIDLVLYKGRVSGRSAGLTGNTARAIGGAVMWPSDHAGLAATLRVG